MPRLVRPVMQRQDQTPPALGLFEHTARPSHLQRVPGPARGVRVVRAPCQEGRSQRRAVEGLGDAPIATPVPQVQHRSGPVVPPLPAVHGSAAHGTGRRHHVRQQPVASRELRVPSQPELLRRVGGQRLRDLLLHLSGGLRRCLREGLGRRRRVQVRHNRRLRGLLRLRESLGREL